MALVPRGGAGVTLPLSQHLCTTGNAIVTVATRGFPQEAADLNVARAHVEVLRVAFKFGAKMFNNHVMEHYAIANTRWNRTSLAELVRKDLVKFALDLHAVSDICGHSWAYLPAVCIFWPSRGRIGLASTPTSV